MHAVVDVIVEQREGGEEVPRTAVGLQEASE
jgi:hypothetical protein